MEDLEIAAMSKISELVAPLDDAAKRRVLSWVAARFDIELSDRPIQLTGTAVHAEASGGGGYEQFVDLFDAANPRTDADKALIGAYWLQIVEGRPDVQSQEINNSLKELGHGVGNITDAFSALQNRKPALVRQVAKSGKSRQARKRYKVTTAGIAAVTGMTRRDGEVG